jgi:hypothetical protein
MTISEMSDNGFFKLRASNLALGKIMHETRFGEVEGISFDLRHPKINPDEWIMDYLGGDEGRPPNRIDTLPFIWFPWHGKFDPAQLEADVIKEWEEENEYRKNPPPTPREVFGKITDAEYAAYLKNERKQKPLGKSWIRKEIATRTPDAIVNVGDHIRISKVIMNIGRDVFKHVHDRDSIHVFVKITNSAGLNQVITTPIVMYGATKLTRYGNQKIYAILERVRKYHDLPKITHASVKEISNNYDRYEVEYAALYRAVKIYEYYLPQIWKLENCPSARLKSIGMRYLSALDDACMLGYAWANAEHNLNMRPFAEVGVKSVSRARRGGMKSGESRRKEADETWKPHAVTLAQNARSKNGSLSREKLVEQIRKDWRLSIKVPAHSTLRNFIAELERMGKLERKVPRQESLSNQVRSRW